MWKLLSTFPFEIGTLTARNQPSASSSSSSCGDLSEHYTTLRRFLSPIFPPLPPLGTFILLLCFLGFFFLGSIIDFALTLNEYSPHSLASLKTQTAESLAQDPRYLSSLNIDWDEISRIIEKLNNLDEYPGIGLLNFDEKEIGQWKQLFPETEQLILHLERAPGNLTWEMLYPEWIDEEEESVIPSCPSLPQLQVPHKPRIDLIAVKLPSGRSSRDVARLHLQLEAARLAASSKIQHQIHVLLVTDHFPIPNLFSCKELVAREGNAWLYKPDPFRLLEKVWLPIGSCELALPIEPEGPFYSEGSGREAYATILHSAQAYVCGAIVAAQSIRATGSNRDLVALVDETISDDDRVGLEAAGWKIYTIQRIRNPRAQEGSYNEWNYSKFRLWQLTDYDKIVFIDADLLVLRNIDFLFGMLEISARGNNATLFNSGVMVIEPCNCTFDLLMDHIDEIVSYNGGDQGYLNEMFTWWHRMPRRMNFLKHFWEGDSEESKRRKTDLFGADPPALYVIHYLGHKPWLCFRDYDCNWNVGFYREFASDAAHKTWWKVHDSMPGNLQRYCLLRTRQKAALEWDRRQAEMANFEDGHWRMEINDDRLRTCVENFCSWESMLLHWGEQNWADN
ncbi:hypothetical protein CDL15_Pgr024012 [Punica granatum]|uniref:Hexosyltransferase n=1 Tax=Punica granatum TaxID=22663 RepID=A0A218XVL4_PUNGR|nr:hypothetical protein CDL15_Pgr024012 [Punica granatum]